MSSDPGRHKQVLPALPRRSCLMIHANHRLQVIACLNQAPISVQAMQLLPQDWTKDGYLGFAHLFGHSPKLIRDFFELIRTDVSER